MQLPSRLISALATLPGSFVFIPYAYWRSKEDPWYRIFLRPLAFISLAWVSGLLVSIAVVWLAAFAFIIWQSYLLKAAVDQNRPKPQVETESWRR